MDSLDNVKNEIKIPVNIDLAVKMGIERGRREKRKGAHRPYRKLTAAAAVLVIITTIGMFNPKIVEAIQNLPSIFKIVNRGQMGENFDKFEQFSTSINKSVNKNGLKVTINEIVIDSNTLAITSTIEGNNLKEDRGYMGSIKLNDQLLYTRNDKNKLIDGNKLLMVTYANVSDLVLQKEVDVDISIVWIGDVKGPWNFKFRVTKSDTLTNSRTIILNNTVKSPNVTLKLDKLVISPLGNTLSYSGTYEYGDESVCDFIPRLMVFDGSGKAMEVNPTGEGASKGKFSGKIEILNDLSGVKSLTVIPVFNSWESISKNIDGVQVPVLQTTINGSDFSIPQEIITTVRPVTEKEKSEGCFLNNITNLFNIDTRKEFCSLESLVGQVIKVNKNTTVIIKSIEATDKETSLIFKIEGKGPYSYRNIGGAVILDDSLYATSRNEGDFAVLENIEDGIVSVKLPPINPNKKYKIALPITGEPEIKEEYKMSFDINK